jgi:hypothetical protein
MALQRLQNGEDHKKANEKVDERGYVWPENRETNMYSPKRRVVRYEERGYGAQRMKFFLSAVLPGSSTVRGQCKMKKAE